MTIECPSGLVVEMRGVMGIDGRVLADEKLIREHAVEERMLANCVTAILDEGPYANLSTKKDWAALLEGDVVFLMIALRNLSHPGKPFVVSLRCPNKMACGSKFDWEIDTEKLLDERARKLPPEAREVVRRGGRHRFPVPGTAFAVEWKPRTRELWKRWKVWEKGQKNFNRRAQERTNPLIQPIAYASVVTGGEKPIDKMDAVQDFLEGLPLGVIQALAQAREDSSCGIETEIDVSCPYCGTDWSIDLPFDKDFFAAPRTSSASTKKSSNDESESSPNEGT